jgi:hypothetical protein
VQLRSLVVYLRETAQTAVSPFVVPREENDDTITAKFIVVRLLEVPHE